MFTKSEKHLRRVKFYAIFCEINFLLLSLKDYMEYWWWNGCLFRLAFNCVHRSLLFGLEFTFICICVITHTHTQTFPSIWDCFTSLIALYPLYSYNLYFNLYAAFRGTRATYKFVRKQRSSSHIYQDFQRS